MRLIMPNSFICFPCSSTARSSSSFSAWVGPITSSAGTTLALRSTASQADIAFRCLSQQASFVGDRLCWAEGARRTRARKHWQGGESAGGGGTRAARAGADESEQEGGQGGGGGGWGRGAGCVLPFFPHPDPRTAVEAFTLTPHTHIRYPTVKRIRLTTLNQIAGLLAHHPKSEQDNELQHRPPP